MLSLPDRHLAQLLAENDAVIVRTGLADAYPGYAYGDRRKRRADNLNSMLGVRCLPYHGA